jgi:endoribonuclease Dicer
MQEMYVCEVILPEKSPVRGLIGKPASQKSLAKQSAAFDTCLLLRKHCLLDEFFISTYHKRLPVMRNAKLAIVSKKTNQYPRITKPAFWTKGCGVTPDYLFATAIILNSIKKLTRDHRSLVLLTRQRLPQFPEFPIFLEEDIETQVCCIPLRKVLTVHERSLNMMSMFTLRVFRDLFNKTYEEDSEMMPYWLLPAAKDVDIFHNDIEPKDVIDWETLEYVQNNDEVPRTDNYEADALKNPFVYDRWNGRYRYFISERDSSLRASDPPPLGVERRRYMDSVMGYCLSLYKNSRATFLSRCDWNQPVFAAELISLRRNLLDKMTDKEKSVQSSSVICLECVAMSSVSLRDRVHDHLRADLDYRFPLPSPHLAFLSQQSLLDLKHTLLQVKLVRICN